jgi:hypothetical protein
MTGILHLRLGSWQEIPFVSKLAYGFENKFPLIELDEHVDAFVIKISTEVILEWDNCFVVISIYGAHYQAMRFLPMLRSLYQGGKLNGIISPTQLHDSGVLEGFFSPTPLHYYHDSDQLWMILREQGFN